MLSTASTSGYKISKVIAIVGQEVITSDDLEKEIDILEATMGGRQDLAHNRKLAFNTLLSDMKIFAYCKRRDPNFIKSLTSDLDKLYLKLNEALQKLYKDPRYHHLMLVRLGASLAVNGLLSDKNPPKVLDGEVERELEKMNRKISEPRYRYWFTTLTYTDAQSKRYAENLIHEVQQASDPKSDPKIGVRKLAELSKNFNIKIVPTMKCDSDLIKELRAHFTSAKALQPIVLHEKNSISCFQLLDIHTANSQVFDVQHCLIQVSSEAQLEELAKIVNKHKRANVPTSLKEAQGFLASLRTTNLKYQINKNKLPEVMLAKHRASKDEHLIGPVGASPQEVIVIIVGEGKVMRPELPTKDKIEKMILQFKEQQYLERMQRTIQQAVYCDIRDKSLL